MHPVPHQNDQLISSSDQSPHSHVPYVQALARGEERRHVAATQLNRYSSRSHTILKLVIVSRPNLPDDYDGHTNDEGVNEAVLRSELLLVDLAGSERAKRKGRHYETRFNEAGPRVQCPPRHRPSRLVS